MPSVIKYTRVKKMASLCEAPLRFSRCDLWHLFSALPSLLFSCALGPFGHVTPTGNRMLLPGCPLHLSHQHILIRMTLVKVLHKANCFSGGPSPFPGYHDVPCVLLGIALQSTPFLISAELTVQSRL